MISWEDVHEIIDAELTSFEGKLAIKVPPKALTSPQLSATLFKR